MISGSLDLALVDVNDDDLRGQVAQGKGVSNGGTYVAGADNSDFAFHSKISSRFCDIDTEYINIFYSIYNYKYNCTFLQEVSVGFVRNHNRISSGWGA